MAIEGPLDELSIQEVMQLLDMSGKTGVLTVRSERLSDQAVVVFDSGTIVFAMRRRSARRLGQQLLRAGKLTQRELKEALEAQRADPTRKLGALLLQTGRVEQAELERQLRFQLEETMYDLMAWDEGHFRFEETAEVATDPFTGRIRVGSLLLEGARRIDEWARLEARISSLEAVPRVAPLAAPDDRDDVLLDLRPDEWQLLAEVDGRRDLRQIAVDLGRSSFDVAKTAYALVSAGVVQIEETDGDARANASADLEATMRELQTLLEQGEVAAAERTVTELRAEYPNHFQLALLTGHILAVAGRMRPAAEAFALAAELDPLSADAHEQLGFAAVRIGELECAARAWETFLRLAPSHDRNRMIERALAAVGSLSSLLEEWPHASATLEPSMEMRH